MTEPKKAIVLRAKREERHRTLRDLLFSNKELLNSLRIQKIPDEQLEKLAERMTRTGQVPLWIKDPKLLSKLVDVING